MEALCLAQPVFAEIACTRLTDVEDVAGVPLLVATGFSLGLVAHEHAVDRDSLLGAHPICVGSVVARVIDLCVA